MRESGDAIPRLGQESALVIAIIHRDFGANWRIADAQPSPSNQRLTLPA